MKTRQVWLFVLGIGLVASLIGVAVLASKVSYSTKTAIRPTIWLAKPKRKQRACSPTWKRWRKN